jgi:GntR family transcriptional regulator
MVIFMTGVPPFDPDSGEPAYVYVRMADHLAARIRAGDLPPGTRLPGERDLAAEYGVALGTARRAVSELRERGLAITLPAKGTFVTSTLPAG